MLHERDILKLHKHIHFFNVAIDKLVLFIECKDEATKEIIKLLVDELERGKHIIHKDQLQAYFSKFTRLYFHWYEKLDIETRDVIGIIIHPLKVFLDTSKEFKTIITTLEYGDYSIPNVLVPSFGMDILIEVMWDHKIYMLLKIFTLISFYSTQRKSIILRY